MDPDSVRPTFFLAMEPDPERYSIGILFTLSDRCILIRKIRILDRYSSLHTLVNGDDTGRD